MKLKLNKCIGVIAIVENLITKKYFDFVYKKSSLSCWKKISPCPPTRKKGLSLIKKIKSREHSAMPTLPGTATAFKEWPHTLSHIPCISSKYD